MVEQSHVVWPPGYEPENCRVHVQNELTMTAKPESVWAWLIRARLWPTWYPNSSNVQFLSGISPDLALRTKFRWKTFGITIQSTVMEFVPCERLAWDAHGTGLDAYHAWLIQKTDQGCRVVTEENQGGALATLNSTLRPNQMKKMHQLWLERLSEKASSGLPPTP